MVFAQPSEDTNNVRNQRTFGSVETETVRAQRQEVVAIFREPAAHVIGVGRKAVACADAVQGCEKRGRSALWLTGPGMMKHSLGEAFELTRLHLEAVVIIHDVVVRFQAAVMEVLVLINARINVVGERRARDACTTVFARHMVPDGVYMRTMGMR